LRLSRPAWLAVSAGVVLAAAAGGWALWSHPHTPAAPNLTKDIDKISPGDGGDDGSDDDKTPANATARQPAKPGRAPAWTVDHAASRLSFRGVMDGVAFDGVFRSWDARIAFDPRNLTGSHAAVIVDTESALTGQPLKDSALPNPEWLDISRFPEATLVTRSITQVSPGHYQAVCDVKIRGYTKRTTVPFSVAVNHNAGRMTATLTLDRRDFHIGEGPWQSPPPVAPAFQVTMQLVAARSR
jgi:polyisoprenoid-binding protein YceI